MSDDTSAQYLRQGWNVLNSPYTTPNGGPNDPLIAFQGTHVAVLAQAKELRVDIKVKLDPQWETMM